MKKEFYFLYELQASLTVLVFKVKNMHWNLFGESFFEVHEELDRMSQELEGLNDQVAEKIVMLNGIALGSYEEVLKKSFISETRGKEWSILEISKITSDDLYTLLNYVEKLKNIDFRIQPLIDEIVISAHRWAWQFKKLSE